MPKRILCYGDSNTWGYIPDSEDRIPDDDRWPGVCGNILGSGYRVLEDGICGRTTAFDQQWADFRNGRKGLAYALLSQKPLDLIAIMLGTNDLCMMELPYVCLGMEELIREAKNANFYYPFSGKIFRDKCRVLLIAPPPFDPIVDTVKNDPACGKALVSKELSGEYQKIARKFDISYLDAGTCSEVSKIDGTHLTVDGHHRLGTAVAEKIKNIFSED